MAYDLIELATEAKGMDPDIAAQMESDAAEWKRQGRDTNLDDDTPEQQSDPARDEHGRFTSSDDEGKPDADQTGADSDVTTEEPKPSQPTEKPQQQTEQQAADAKKAADEQAERKRQETEQTKSKWAREQERKSRTWEEINKTKAELQAERDQVKLEREQLAAQQQALTGQVKDESGFTASDYQKASQRFTSLAQQLRQQQLQAEARGDFDAADRVGQQADKQESLAKQAAERASGMSVAGPGAGWSRLAEDLPEAMQSGNPMFAEIRKLIRENPKILADPFGPYRAAVQIGRRVLGETQAALTKAQSDAAKVPALEKQVAEMSAQLKHLTRLTSLPGDGGILSREGSEGRRFEDLSLADMEARLAGELG